MATQQKSARVAKSKRVAARLSAVRAELVACPVPTVQAIAGYLEHLAVLEKDRGVDAEVNLLSRLGTLVALAELAEVGRRGLHAKEANRHKLQLASALEDADLVEEVMRLTADGEPVKVIMEQLRLGKDRVHRIKRLAEARADYLGRFLKGT